MRVVAEDDVDVDVDVDNVRELSGFELEESARE